MDIELSKIARPEWAALLPATGNFPVKDLPSRLGIQGAVRALSALHPDDRTPFLAAVAGTALYILDPAHFTAHTVKNCLRSACEPSGHAGSLSIHRHNVIGQIEDETPVAVCHALQSVAAVASSRIDVHFGAACACEVYEVATEAVSARVVDAYDRVAEAYEAAHTATEYEEAGEVLRCAMQANAAAWVGIAALFQAHFA